MSVHRKLAEGPGSGRARPGLVLAALLLAGWPTALGAAVCTVPGTHATLQQAVADPMCSEIRLAAQTYSESPTVGRTLDLEGDVGGGTRIAGQVVVGGSATVAQLADLAVEAPGSCLGPGGAALWVRDGARTQGANLRVTLGGSGICRLFGEGFESGTTGAWSVHFP